MFLVRSTPATPGAPGTPSQSVTTVSSSTLRVTPSGTAPAGWRSWRIEVGDTGSGPWTVLQTAWPANQAYDHTGLAASTTKHYRVQGTTNDGQVSAYSTATSGTTSAAPSTAYAPGFPRLAAVPISGPFSAYDTTAFLQWMGKHHIRIWTHYNQMAGSEGWSRSMRDLMAAAIGYEPGSMSVDGLDFIYVVNNEIPSSGDPATQRIRDWLSANKGYVYPSGTSGTPVASSFDSSYYLINNSQYRAADVGGTSLFRYLAQLWYQQHVTGEPGNAANDQVKGLFLDNVFYKPRVSGDWNRDGTLDDRDNATVAVWHRTGLKEQFDEMWLAWPTARYMIGNIADWANAGTAVGEIAPLNGVLDGGVMESLMGESYSVYNWGGVEGMLRHYRFMEDACRSPKLCVFSARIDSVTSYQQARLALCWSLVGGDGYAQLYAGGYSATDRVWLDEFDNAGAGLEYLGTASDARQTAVHANGVWRRQFSGGVVYVNPTGSAGNVTAPRALKRINGSQAPSVNSGATIANGATISIPANDGLILLNN